MRFKEFSTSNNEGLNETNELKKELEEKKRTLKILREADEVFGTDSYDEIIALKIEIDDLEFELEHGRKKTQEDYDAELEEMLMQDPAYREMLKKQENKKRKHHKQYKGNGIDTDWIAENEVREYKEFDPTDPTIQNDDEDAEILRMLYDDYPELMDLDEDINDDITKK